MEDNQFQQYRTYFRTIRRLLLFIGLWPEKWALSQRLYLVLNIFCCAAMCCVILNFCQYHLPNISLATSGMSLGVGFGAVLVKLVCFAVHRKSVVELHETLRRYFDEDLANVETRPLILSHISNFKRVSFAFIISTAVVVAFYVLSPAIAVIVQRNHEVEPVRCLLVVPAKYPWTITGDSILCPIHYMIEAYAMLSMLFVTTAVDSLFGLYVFQMVAVLSGIGHRMANLGHSDDYKTVIHQCVERHQAIARCRDTLERVYGVAVLYIIFTSSVIICALTFQATLSANLKVGKLVVIALYITLKMLQTWMYSSFGSVLTTESEKFREAVYASGWSESRDKRFTNDVLIIMTQRPLVLRACSVSNISTDMFIAVSNTAVSYFFLLKTLESEV